MALRVAFLALCWAGAAGLEAGRPARLRFDKLSASTFRHPLDLDLTQAVQGLPLAGFVESALRRSAAPLEQTLRLDLLSNALRVSEAQLPDVHALLIEACAILDVEKIPELYVQSSPQANAYTLGLQGETPFVVVTSALLDKCTPEETRAVIGHELGHLKCEHSVWLTIAGLAADLPLVGSTSRSIVQRWRLAAELTCDRAALLVAQDSTVVAGALLKLVAGTGVDRLLSAEAFMQQSLDYEAALEKANPLVRLTLRSQDQRRTHPLPVKRVTELDRWSKTPQFQKILATGSPLSLNAGAEAPKVAAPQMVTAWKTKPANA